MGELSEQNRALVERVEPEYFGWQRAPDAILNRLLDAARAEGRGEGEPGPFSVIGENGLTLHPATADLVSRFMGALAEKLAAAEAKYGYSDGWASPIWQEECRRQLHHHAAKGDPRDVAAYAAFCWHHGWSTASPIREPEISKLTKEAIIDAIRENVSADIHFDLCRVEEAADAILNLAPVGGRGEGWRPISEAPRDGTYILADVAKRSADDRWAHLAGRAFVVRHEGRTPSGYDLGWSVHPGFGGCADDWFSGWQPLPPPPQERGGMK